MKTQTIVIRPDGTAVAIHSDRIAGALRATSGQDAIRIRRASHVEPDEAGNWIADMSPVAGPVLGPFTTRHEALEAELEWLAGRLATIPVA